MSPKKHDDITVCVRSPLQQQSLATTAGNVNLEAVRHLQEWTQHEANQLQRVSNLQSGSSNPVLGKSKEIQQRLPFGFDDHYDDCSDDTSNPEYLVHDAGYILHEPH